MYCEIIHELLLHQGETEHNILYNVLWDYTWTINTSGRDQNTTFYIMYCDIIHELLIHQGETEHNILYNVLWDYTWTINSSGMRQNTTLYIMYCEIIHELLIHQGESVRTQHSHSTLYRMLLSLPDVLIVHV